MCLNPDGAAVWYILNEYQCDYILMEHLYVKFLSSSRVFVC